MSELKHGPVIEFASQQEILRNQIDSALDNAQALMTPNKLARLLSPWPVVDIPTFSLGPDGIVFIHARPIQDNDVYLSVKESHLFPWLCHEVYERVDIQEKTEESLVNHELSHFSAALAARNIEPKIGFSFYKDTKRPTSVIVEANVLIEGQGTIEEIKTIISAPGEDMSKQDKAALREFDHYIRRNSRNIWPAWPVGSMYSSRI